MSLDDKIKWERKYSTDEILLALRPHSKKLDYVLKHLNGNKILDVACGSGRNAIYLANNNYIVDAYDISKTALDKIDRYNLKNLTTYEIDLDEFNPENLDYDLILMTNFLDRELIKKISKAMKKDSIFFIETYMNHELNEKKHSNPDFLLVKDELKSMFGKTNFEILNYDEHENENFELHRMFKQSIVVRKIY